MEYGFREYKKSELLRGHLNVGGADDKGNRIDVTNLYFERNGRPCIDVMGEFHFARCNRENWKETLCKMKAGGVTIVASYLFWNYHEEIEGEFDFSGDLDVRAFVKECQKVGLDVIIRIGPWAHGEARYGGFPDWLMKKPYVLRENNEEYLEKVRIFYEKIYEQVQGLFYKDGGNIIGVQLENELVDNAEHLLTLKQMAQEIGYDAPLWTVTGWNSLYGAKIPVDDVVPVFSAYPEAPWSDTTEKLPLSPHYVFNQMRNDAAVGVDLMKASDEDGWRLPYEKYPFATCELGGGIQVTHHRRPLIQGMDIYALSLSKLGSGNNLIGYYMYCGGTNKIGKLSTLNESKATGYPNDYSILSYDFQTMISEYGELREQYRLTNLLHLMAQEFGDVLAPMEAVDSVQNVLPEDMDSLRYSMRTDGKSGFVFVNHYQRLAKLHDVNNVVIDTGVVKFPAFDVKGEIAFVLPFGLRLDEETLEYATAQPICREGDTYFFTEIPGITAEYKFADRDALQVKAGMGHWLKVGDIKIVTLTWDQARFLRKLEGEVYVGEECDLIWQDKRVKAAAPGVHHYYSWEGEDGFERLTTGKVFTQAEIAIEPLESIPFTPKYMEELALGSERALSYAKVSVTTAEGFVEIPNVGDVLQLYTAENEMIADNFYYGKPWRLPAKLLFGKELYLVVSEFKDDFYKEY
ncbi:MAG: hypothetical protein E7260_06245 [Lachnospiraceae bacterium]|nr:hypothetical protein [Lachnospiraceae bacterium]